MEEGDYYSEVHDELPRRWEQPQPRRCCRQGPMLVLLGLATVALWAGLLTLLLHWHWDSEQNLRKLEEIAARNVSQVFQLMERHSGSSSSSSSSSQVAEKFQAAQLSHQLEELQAEQKKMQSQDSSLAENLAALGRKVTDLKSLNMNEKYQTQNSVAKLWAEVARLWIELRVANARRQRATPGETSAPPTQSRAPLAPTAVPTTSVPSLVPTTVPTTMPTAVPTTSVPSPVSTTMPTTMPTAVPTTNMPSPVSTTVPTIPTASSVPSLVPTSSVPSLVPTSSMPSPGPTTAAPLSLSSAPGSLCNICPPQWVNFQTKCYYFGQGPKKWIQAREACRGLQGELVSIHSQAEQDFLTKRASRIGSWIGLRDLDVEGQFIWMDERPLNYSNWAAGEPNNAGLGEDCVMMQGTGQWNDAFCRSPVDGWVCDRLATC